MKNNSEINTSHAPYVARKTGIDTTTAFKTVIGSAINAVAQITVEALMMIRLLFVLVGLINSDGEAQGLLSLWLH